MTLYKCLNKHPNFGEDIRKVKQTNDKHHTVIIQFESYKGCRKELKDFIDKA